MAEKNYQSNEQKNKQTNYTGSNQTNKETASNSKMKNSQKNSQKNNSSNSTDCYINPLREDRLAVLFLCNKPSSRKQSQTQIRTLRISY